MAKIINYTAAKRRICKRRKAEIEAEIKEQYDRENLMHDMIMFILQVVLIVAAFLVVGS